MILKCKWAAGLLMVVFLAGCSSTKPDAISASAAVAGSARAVEDLSKIDLVAVVRESTITGYPTATIGKAFEAAFRDFQWHTSSTPEGIGVVKFTGRLPVNIRPDCPAAKTAKKGTPAPTCTQDGKVTFEWTFTPGTRFFHLSYVDTEPWPEALRSTHEMLEFIYG